MIHCFILYPAHLLISLFFLVTIQTKKVLLCHAFSVSKHYDFWRMVWLLAQTEKCFVFIYVFPVMFCVFCFKSCLVSTRHLPSVYLPIASWCVFSTPLFFYLFVCLSPGVPFSYHASSPSHVFSCFLVRVFQVVFFLVVYINNCVMLPACSWPTLWIMIMIRIMIYLVCP